MAKNKNSLSDEKLKSAAGGSSVKQRGDDGWYVFDEELGDQISRTFDTKEEADLYQMAYDNGKDKGYWKGKEDAKKNY